MDTIALSTQARSSEKNAKGIRRNDLVPCVVYGNQVENTAFQCDYNELYRTYAKAGESTIVELDLDGKKVPVLFHSLDFDPVTDRIIHVDFFAVNMKKEIEAQVPVHFVGESPAVEAGGILVSVHDHLTVRCLPSDLPHALEVSLDPLVEMHASITVADVALPKGVTVDEDPETVIATVQEPRAEQVEEETSESESAEGETKAEEKKDGGEGQDS